MLVCHNFFALSEKSYDFAKFHFTRILSDFIHVFRQHLTRQLVASTDPCERHDGVVGGGEASPCK